MLPGTVILGGSVARGDAHDGSDIDLLHIIDRDPQPGQFFDTDAMKATEEVCRWPVSVITIDWAQWISRVKWASTIESAALREGLLLRWVRPGDDVNWRRVGTVQQVRDDMVAWALGMIEESAGRVARWRERAATVETEPRAMVERHPQLVERIGSERYPQLVEEVAFGWLNVDAHYLAERAFLLLCHLSATPFRNHGRLLGLLDDLPAAERATVSDCWTPGDVRWVGKWRKAGYWDPADPPRRTEHRGPGGTIMASPERYEKTSGSDYREGTERHVRLVAALTLATVEHATREQLGLGPVEQLGDARAAVGRLVADLADVS